MYSWLQKYIVFITIGLIVFASTWALFKADFFMYHDVTQGARIVEMTHALQDWHIPANWSSNLGYGYGMPLFEFYAPLPYYIGAALYMGGFSLINSVKILLFISSLLTAIGGYLIGRKLFGTASGLLTSAAITLAPYRAVNIYVRGALSEAWGIMCFPFILLGIIKTIKNEKYGWVILTLTITILLLSHNLTALIFLPLSVVFGAGYMLFEILENKKKVKDFWSTFLRLTGSYFLAFILSTFYTIPALLEKNFTNMESVVLADYFDYHLHFVYIRQFFSENWGFTGSTYGPMDGISFYLGFGQLLGLFLSLYVVLKAIKNMLDNKNKIVLDSHTLIYMLVLFLTFVSLLLTTQKTQFIWDSFSALTFLQFPWRYLSAAIVFLGITIGALVQFLPNAFLKWIYSIFLLAVLLLLNFNYFKPQEFISNLSEFYHSDSNRLRSAMSPILRDYIPIQITQDEIEPVALEGQLLYCQVLNNCMENFEIVTDTVQKKVVTTDFSSEQTLVFALSDFPGWTTSIDGVNVEKSQSEEGYIQTQVPAGKHTITVELKNTVTRTIANFVSLVGLLIFASVFFWYYKSNDRNYTS